MAEILHDIGFFMVIDIPLHLSTIKGVGISLGKFRIKCSRNGTNKVLDKCVAFVYEHGIVPHIDYCMLDEIEEIVRSMQKSVSFYPPVFRYK
jgi:D-arabinose 1-dehydrogenase-like Zn-dependent alcohol dehydrogenase